MPRTTIKPTRRNSDSGRAPLQVTRLERWRYRFDNWMSRGTVAIMTLLGLATLVFVGAVGLIVVLFHAYPENSDRTGFWDVVWGNLMRTLDPGTMGGDAGWAFRVLMLLVTIGGLIIVASLIGIVSGAFNDKIIALRRGRSRVIETGHTLILGWNNQLFTILNELCIANESNRRSTIVVVADHDKVDMEERIRKRVPSHGSTSIICRRADPLSQADLHVGSPTTARSIVVLPSDDAPHPDATVIKTALALSNLLHDDEGPSVIAELRDPLNLDAARLAGGERARWLLAGALISRMTVQTCLQGGLSAVCTELLDFARDEVYFTGAGDLAGATFLEAQLAFRASTVIGIVGGGGLELNPPAHTVIEPHDQLILIAEDDSVIEIGQPGAIDERAISTLAAEPKPPERTLVLGYNSSLHWVLDDLGKYVARGSSVHVVTDSALSDELQRDGLEVTVERADTTSRSVLERLDAGAFEHILVLSYRDAVDAQVADAKTLVTLLHLRDIADRDKLDINIVSEMIDDRNRQLAEITRPDDFIVSNRLVSLMLAQVSENPRLIEVFEQLFSGDGSEVYVRPAELYISPGCEADFYTVSAAAARRRETAIGFRIADHALSRSQSYGIHLNPDKSERRTFAAGDSVIVLAQDD
jgi:voltage-gated potassium channel Kch